MATNKKTASEKVAVVTGANKGIGFETVRQLALEGAIVVLTARDEKRGKEATALLNGKGLSNVVFHQLDVRDPLSVASIAKFISTQFGKLDILVNNAAHSGVAMDVEALKALNIDTTSWLSGAATNKVQGLMRTTYETAEECLDTNYYGCNRVTQALIPLLQLSTSGARIVNVSSHRGELRRIPNEKTRAELEDINKLTEEKIEDLLQKFLKDLKCGSLGANGWSLMLPAYCISKATLNAYTRLLAKKYPEMCINCVHLGYVGVNWHTGTVTVEEGARGSVMLAMLPQGGPTGCYFDQMEIAAF